MGNKEILVELGLTKAETETYQTLLKKGNLTATNISKETGLNRSNIYRILDNLSNLKLVTAYTSNKVKYFSANDPSKLRDLYKQKIESLNNKEKELNKIISAMIEIKKEKKSKEETDFSVSVYSGIEELKRVVNMLLSLKRGETTYTIGYKGALKNVFPDFWEKFKKERIRRGILFKGVLSKENIKDITKPLHSSTQLRCADLGKIANMRIDFFRETIIFFITKEKEEPKAIVIKNKEMVNGLKAYFNFLWENAIIPPKRFIKS
ncbi:TrmB family transcriptional regulator [Nanoarchaeota archaeon]